MEERRRKGATHTLEYIHRWKDMHHLCISESHGNLTSERLPFHIRSNLWFVRSEHSESLGDHHHVERLYSISLNLARIPLNPHPISGILSSVEDMTLKETVF